MAPAASAAILTTWPPQLKKNFYLLSISNQCFGSISYWLMPVSESITLTDWSGLSHSPFLEWREGSAPKRSRGLGVRRGRVLPQRNIRRKTDAGPANPTVTLQGTSSWDSPHSACSVVPFLSLSQLPHYSASLNTFPHSLLISHLVFLPFFFFFSHLTPPTFPFRLILAKAGEHLNF